jgi:large subunit ribosomal protein L27
MAHTKSLGSTKLGRDSESKRLGIKVTHGQIAKAGEIVLRQRGNRYLTGKNIRRAGDDTLYAAVTGTVQYKQTKKTGYSGIRRYAKIVSLIPAKQ